MWEQSTQSSDVCFKVVNDETFEQIDDDIAIKVTDGFQRTPIRPLAASEPLENASINIDDNENSVVNVDSFNEVLNQFRFNEEGDNFLVVALDNIIDGVDFSVGAGRDGRHLDNSETNVTELIEVKQEKPTSNDNEIGVIDITNDEAQKENRSNSLSVSAELFNSGIEDRRVFHGSFRCTNCANRWHSGNVYMGKWQKCCQCDMLNYPHYVMPVTMKDRPRTFRRSGGPVRGHMASHCQKCKELGHPCREERLAAVAPKRSQSTKSTYLRLRI